jgi:rare lipoprotein A
MPTPKKLFWISIASLLPLLAQPALAAGKKTKIPDSFSGNVSWYGVPFHGRLTACGEVFNMNKCTCAHLKLPFHTMVLVEDPRNGKTVIVRVTDRGPYAKGRVMDLAREAARKLGTLSRGVAYVDCTVIKDEEDDTD